MTHQELPFKIFLKLDTYYEAYRDYNMVCKQVYIKPKVLDVITLIYSDTRIGHYLGYVIQYKESTYIIGKSERTADIYFCCSKEDRPDKKLKRKKTKVINPVTHSKLGKNWYLDKDNLLKQTGPQLFAEI